MSCNFYNNTKNNVQFHRSNNIVDGLHIQALEVCTLVVSNLLLLFLHELNKCNTKSRSKLYELDKDDVKRVFFVFRSGKTLLGIVSWFLFFFFLRHLLCPVHKVNAQKSDCTLTVHPPCKPKLAVFTFSDLFREHNILTYKTHRKKNKPLVLSYDKIVLWGT